MRGSQGAGCLVKWENTREESGPQLIEETLGVLEVGLNDPASFGIKREKVRKARKGTAGAAGNVMSGRGVASDI